jgi:hypothetical protein
MPPATKLNTSFDRAPPPAAPRVEIHRAAGADPDRRVATGLGTRIGARRVALHLALGALGWLILGGFWVWQLAVYIPPTWVEGIVLLGAIFAVYVVLTPIWVAWNRSIHRRRHSRTTPLLREVRLDRDALGRPTVGSPSTQAALIRVSLIADGRLKRYLVEETTTRAAARRAPLGSALR